MPDRPKLRKSVHSRTLDFSEESLRQGDFEETQYLRGDALRRLQKLLPWIAIQPPLPLLKVGNMSDGPLRQLQIAPVQRKRNWRSRSRARRERRHRRRAALVPQIVEKYPIFACSLTHLR